MAEPEKAGSHYVSAAFRPHGTGVRGINLPRQSRQFEGRFGRMFRTLPAAVHDEDDLIDLGVAMTAGFEPQPTPETMPDDEENPGISAGYTYLGQFIDHDLTFDPASSLQRQNDPDGLTDFRTPRFDLDCIYGRGPDDQPYLYQNDGVRMLLGKKLTGSAFDPDGTRSVPRNTPEEGTDQSLAPGKLPPRRALIGDPRNDENVIVSNLQSTMLRFHNQVADMLEERHGKATRFEQVQREVRYHYQWVVLHDFLPTIIGRDRVLSLLPELASDGMRQGPRDFPANAGASSIVKFDPKLRFYKPNKNAFMPVEFSVAAYRFGHSMIRPVYRLNTTLAGTDFPVTGLGDGRQLIFDVRSDDHLAESLVGFREFPTPWALDWSLFFRMEPNPPVAGPDRLQPAYKIDTSLVNPLGTLPLSVASDQRSLPARNLVRGLKMSLPSGQAVARAMGFMPIPDANLTVRKAINPDPTDNPVIPLTRISEDFAGNAPLWYYILAEAQQQFVDAASEIRLGDVGGSIVGEVFVGLLWADSHSYIQQHPGWQPSEAFVSAETGIFGMAELIRAARGERIGGRMARSGIPRALNVALHPSKSGAPQGAASRHRSAAGTAGLVSGLAPSPNHNLRYRGGRLLPDLAFANFYVGGQAAWKQSDIQSIDDGLTRAMSDSRLNSVMAQYMRGQPVTSTFKGSRVLPGSPPREVSKGDVEALVQDLLRQGALSNFDLSKTVFNLLLPGGTVLTTDITPTSGPSASLTGGRPPVTLSAARAQIADSDEDDQASSLEGLGGYHGSVRNGNARVYYSVGVFSEPLQSGEVNGIVAFDAPWKNVVATFYHELCEARTDPDVEEANQAGDRSLVGWTSRQGEECGDFPIFEDPSLSHVFAELALADGSGTVPIQLQYSNRVNGPEDPTL